MELTSSFLDLLPHFAPVFTAPTYQTFTVIVAGCGSEIVPPA